MIIWLVIGSIPVILSALKIVNYARWALKKKNLRGGLGLYLLAVITVIYPLLVYLFNFWK